ncbi:hypothetical protein [Frigidibacter sp.]|uniref:hypothetical protein n=1 Tax=Frigidibacter sp. TaxID=2586418 RepID=UPI0027372905|nr:hypothetical protein [Frigidibacter sp.]MDP3339329.1 hypothetical protein [Frigidibacter sp.]
MTPIHSPFDPNRNLTDDELKAERTLPRPELGTPGEAAERGYRIHPADRLLVRGPWEMAASILIGLGVIMLMQPFFLWAYTWSFLVTLTGTVMFIIVSHFPE